MEAPSLGVDLFWVENNGSPRQTVPGDEMSIQTTNYASQLLEHIVKSNVFKRFKERNRNIRLSQKQL